MRPNKVVVVQKCSHQHGAGHQNEVAAHHEDRKPGGKLSQSADPNGAEEHNRRDEQEFVGDGIQDPAKLAFLPELPRHPSINPVGKGRHRKKDHRRPIPAGSGITLRLAFIVVEQRPGKERHQ